ATKRYTRYVLAQFFLILKGTPLFTLFPYTTLFRSKLFRIRMSRNFGMKMLTMTNLSTECLIQLTKLGYDATPFNQILKQNGVASDRKSGSAGMPRPISYAVFCLKKKKERR